MSYVVSISAHNESGGGVLLPAPKAWAWALNSIKTIIVTRRMFLDVNAMMNASQCHKIVERQNARSTKILSVEGQSITCTGADANL